MPPFSLGRFFGNADQLIKTAPLFRLQHARLILLVHPLRNDQYVAHYAIDRSFASYLQPHLDALHTNLDL